MNRGAVLRWAGAVAILLLVVVLALRVALQPERLTRFVLGAAGDALGLEITAAGVGEYRLRGSPMLVARDVVARVPGAEVPLLRAGRVLIQVPWSTVRSRGAVLDIERVELDGARVDVAALRAWLSTRPAGDGDLPTLRRGLRLRDARVDGDGWSLHRLDLDLPRLHAGERVRARLKGEARIAAAVIGFDLTGAATRPAMPAGFAASGAVALRQGDLRIPLRVRLSGHAAANAAGLQLAPLRLAAAGRVAGGGPAMAFAAAVDGPARRIGDAWTFGPAGYVLRGDPPLPRLDAGGTVGFAENVLTVDVDGRLAQWPAGWPELLPLTSSTEPITFGIGYGGAPDVSDPARVQLAWAGAGADVSFRLREVLAWTAAAASGSPLPPLTGSARVPVVDVSGARLEGVEIEFDPPSARIGDGP